MRTQNSTRLGVLPLASLAPWRSSNLRGFSVPPAPPRSGMFRNVPQCSTHPFVQNKATCQYGSSTPHSTFSNPTAFTFTHSPSRPALTGSNLNPVITPEYSFESASRTAYVWYAPSPVTGKST